MRSTGAQQTGQHCATSLAAQGAHTQRWPHGTAASMSGSGVASRHMQHSGCGGAASTRRRSGGSAPSHAQPGAHAAAAGGGGAAARRNAGSGGSTIGGAAWLGGA